MIVYTTVQDCWSRDIHHVSLSLLDLMRQQCCTHRFHGKYPFVGDTEAATTAKVLRGALVLPNEGTCSQNVRSFIKATLTQDPLYVSTIFH